MLNVVKCGIILQGNGRKREETLQNEATKITV
jgi:hypothetical protein